MEHPFECAVQPTTVKEHKLTHPVVYGWKVADAPSESNYVPHTEFVKLPLMKSFWKRFAESLTMHVPRLASL